MKVPLNWLTQYVDIPASIMELTDKLTAIGHMQDKKPEKVGDDMIIDLEVRQNRSDCYSILGVAREVAAVTENKIKSENSKIQIDNVSNEQLLKISNTDPTLCLRFSAVRIKLTTQNTRLQTPPWMKAHLEAYGMKTISPLVDVTNYVMIETGEPMHAFDVRQVQDAHIAIRRAKKDEKLTVLGGRELTLTTDDLVIADGEKILSFSGLIGAEGTGIAEDTQECILEAATYNQACIRRSSIRHALRTEASTRHEKFLDPRLVDVALSRALQLIGKMGEYEVVATAESYPTPVVPVKIDLRLSEVSRLGGIDISIDTANQLLRSLGFDTTISSQLSAISCIVPYWRTDITCEADLVEEVLRLYGYENIPSILPPFAPPSDVTSYPYKLDDEIRTHMQLLGFDEVMTEPLTSTERYKDLSKKISGIQPVKLQNALNVDKSMLRFEMDEGLRHAYLHHQKFGRSTIKLFELGTVYAESTNSETTPRFFEHRQFAFVLHDTAISKELLYRQAKGVVESLCIAVGITYDDALVSCSVWDPHTIFGSIDLTIHFGIEKRHKTSAKGLLYTTVPNIQSFDVSCAVWRNSPIGEMVRGIKTNIAGVAVVTVPDQPHILNDDQQSVLFHIELDPEITNKTSHISQVQEYLEKKFEASIR